MVHHVISDLLMQILGPGTSSVKDIEPRATCTQKQSTKMIHQEPSDNQYTGCVTSLSIIRDSYMAMLTVDTEIFPRPETVIFY